MTVSETTLPVPSTSTTTIGEFSRSPSPALKRNPSRSPQPYSRRQRLGTPLVVQQAFNAQQQPTPVNSRSTTPLRGGSESGTEADNELTRRLPAPPRRRGISSEDDVWDDNGKGRRWRLRANRKNDGEPRKPERPKRFGVAVLRRVIEIGLAAVLVVIVLIGRERRALKEVLLRKRGPPLSLLSQLRTLFGCTDMMLVCERDADDVACAGVDILCWFIPYSAIILAYPMRVLCRYGSLRRPRSLDPSPLLYPTIFPILIALSLTPVGANISNPYLLTNLVISISNLPPVLVPSLGLRWVLSLFPLLPAQWDRPGRSLNNTLSLITPINTSLTSALTDILYPSLTASELRLLSSALINLLFHAESPQAVILRSLIWGGGIAVFLLCEDVVRWNVGLARVPFHRFRRAGNAVIGVGRFRRLVGLDQRARSEQASESEAEIAVLKKPLRQLPKSRNYFATLTQKQAKIRRLGYAAYVYGLVIGFVLLCLRPYIGKTVLDGLDPFIWAPGYVFCGQTWYQRAVDKISPGTGYCVTAGSTEAANLRLSVIGLWALILTVGLTFVTTFAPRMEVDTRRKVFHGMIVPMFLIPGLFDPPFTHLCLGLAVAIFLLCDLIRAGQLPPLSRYIARFLQPYVDGRDLKGPMVISHVFLLIGTGVGWWLTLAGRTQDNWDWDQHSELAFSSGVACVGLGDAAASLIGRRFGKHKWGWKGGKSMEGSLAFTVAVVSGLSIARLWITGGSKAGGDWGPAVWGKLIFTGLWGSMLEAVATGVNDNVVVPLGVWAVVRGFGL